MSCPQDKDDDEDDPLILELMASKFLALFDLRIFLFVFVFNFITVG